MMTFSMMTHITAVSLAAFNVTMLGCIMTLYITKLTITTFSITTFSIKVQQGVDLIKRFWHKFTYTFLKAGYFHSNATNIAYVYQLVYLTKSVS
jgi:hypothetical protein